MQIVNSNAVDRVVIVGGGTAGWMAAASLSLYLGNRRRTFTLIESDAIGIVGVGEATIPPIRDFNASVGIDEDEFIRETRATFKLGIEFCNWGQIGDRYFHPFGSYGQEFHGVQFHQLWLRENARDGGGKLAEYSMSAVAAAEGRFARPRMQERTPLAQLAYAFHFDAGRFAAYLRKQAEARGVIRVEGRIVQVHRNGENGNVTSVQLESGERVEGDIFLDCSGFRGLLIEQALGTGFDDWSQWLPCDRALAMPTANSGRLDPFTRSTAHSAGWQWRIPLQHRTGNGHVFSSAFIDADKAERLLRTNVEGEILGDPRLLRFTTGARKQAWNHNVVALGLSAGFLEPLESTSIHLIHEGIGRFIALFPEKEISPVEREEYNRGMRDTYEDVRDFVILHYKATQRSDTDFWTYVRSMKIPDSLRLKLELWRLHGRIFQDRTRLFQVPSWVSVMLGQNIWPDRYDPAVDALNSENATSTLLQMRDLYRNTALQLPDHESYLRQSGAWAEIA